MSYKFWFNNCQHSFFIYHMSYQVWSNQDASLPGQDHFRSAAGCLLCSGWGINPWSHAGWGDVAAGHQQQGCMMWKPHGKTSYWYLNKMENSVQTILSHALSGMLLLDIFYLTTNNNMQDLWNTLTLKRMIFMFSNTPLCATWLFNDWRFLCMDASQ